MFTTNTLLQKVLETKEIQYLNVLPQYLFNEIEQNYVGFIYDYLKKYSKLPSVEIFTTKFKSFRVDDTLAEVPTMFIYDELKPVLLEEYINNKNAEQIKAGKSITDPNYLIELSEKVKIGNPEFVNYSELNRTGYFENNHQISWGLKKMNEWFGSLYSTDLVGIFGRLKSNKTTFMQLIAYTLYAQEKRNILVFSNENTPLQFAQVFDAFVGEFNNKDFRTLDKTKIELLKEKIGNVEKKVKKHTGSIILAGRAGTPNDIIAGIRQCTTKPDVIFLDGLHAMNFSSKDSSSQSLSIAETMKQLRNITYDYNIPIIFVTQANRNAAKTDEPGAESVALSDSITQYVDIMMGCSIVTETLDNRPEQLCKVFLTANRYGEQGVSTHFHMNYDTRKFKFLNLNKESDTIEVVVVDDDQYLNTINEETNKE